MTEPTPVLWIIAVESTSDQFALIYRPVVGIGAGLHAPAEVPRVTGQVAGAVRVTAQDAGPKPLAVCLAIHLGVADVAPPVGCFSRLA